MDKIDKVILAVSVVLVMIVIITSTAVVIAKVQNGNDNAWEEFAHQVNKDIDYYLEHNTGGIGGYIKTADTDYTRQVRVSWSSDKVEYSKVYAKEGGLAQEWHTVKNGVDVHTSTTYIPYDAICYVQANKVV